MANNFYVYMLLDTRKPEKFFFRNFEFEYKPFYVGKGKDYRYADHSQYSTLIKENNRKSNTIKSIIKKTNNPPHVVFLYKNLSNEESLEIEKQIIYELKRYIDGGILLNVTEGGENPPILSGEQNGFFKKHHTKETKQKMREAKLGKKLTKEHKKKFSDMRKGSNNSFYGKTHSQKTKQKQRDAKLNKTRTIYRFITDDNTEIIIKNLTEFCKQNNYRSSCLISLVKGRCKHSYIFKFGEIIQKTSKFIPI